MLDPAALLGFMPPWMTWSMEKHRCHTQPWHDCAEAAMMADMAASTASARRAVSVMARLAKWSWPPTPPIIVQTQTGTSGSRSLPLPRSSQPHILTDYLLYSPILTFCTAISCCGCLYSGAHDCRPHCISATNHIRVQHPTQLDTAALPAPKLRRDCVSFRRTTRLV